MYFHSFDPRCLQVFKNKINYVQNCTYFPKYGSIACYCFIAATFSFKIQAEIGHYHYLGTLYTIIHSYVVAFQKIVFIKNLSSLKMHIFLQIFFMLTVLTVISLSCREDP